MVQDTTPLMRTNGARYHTTGEDQWCKIPHHGGPMVLDTTPLMIIGIRFPCSLKGAVLRVFHALRLQIEGAVLRVSNALRLQIVTPIKIHEKESRWRTLQNTNNVA
ncbi:uncharacterized protein LOC117101603 [Anneissia japonica]|uniref:uncharacterized protein LOC117101603 n=1 Tax=Anneissia japonica TaxID=1529436 RepID=UPI0014259B2D|nr:uncharacterized protein LOC117101603 [Anneissia japonica]